METYTFHITTVQKKALKKLALEQGKAVSELIRSALDVYLLSVAMNKQKKK